MAVTDAGTPDAPNARGVGQPRRERVVRSTRPPTLGDKLNEVLRQKGQTSEQAARSMGVTAAEVLAWSADAEPPGPAGTTALRTYLGVDERQLRGLVLRGQMRLVQTRIRT